MYYGKFYKSSWKSFRRLSGRLPSLLMGADTGSQESGIIYWGRACAKRMTSIQITEEADRKVGESSVKNFCKTFRSTQFKFFIYLRRLFQSYTSSCFLSRQLHCTLPRACLCNKHLALHWRPKMVLFLNCPPVVLRAKWFWCSSFLDLRISADCGGTCL